MAPPTLANANADASTYPSPLSAKPVSSSFDDDFFEESRWQKITRKIWQEPLIPLGCVATSYALYQASKSIRQGNPTRTNKMFRWRIYAQGFTLVAIVVGSFYYRDERIKRQAGDEKLEEQRQREKKEKWLRELEARDEEDRRWRAQIEKAERQREEATKADNVQAKAKLNWSFWSSTPKSESTPTPTPLSASTTENTKK